MTLAQFFCETWASLWRKQGFAECDGIRSLALLAVLTCHSKFGLSDAMLGWFGEDLPMRKIGLVLQGGEIGVDFFLVLSGFLIGGSLMREAADGRIDWSKFYVRRLFRIIPAYFAAILLGIIIDEYERKGCLKRGWLNTLFINNYFRDDTCLDHSWSIAVEMQLYLATPPVFMLVAWLRSKYKRLPSTAACITGVCVVVCIISCVLRLWRFLTVENLKAGEKDGWLQYPGRLYFATQYKIPSYATGVIVGIFVDRQKQSSTSEIIKIGAKPCFEWAMFMGASTVILAAISLGGGDADQIEVIWLGLRFGSRPLDTWWIRCLRACLRPAVDASAAYMLLLAVSGRAPVLARLLGAKVWQPVAALSYSSYLIQFMVQSNVVRPMYNLLSPSLEHAAFGYKVLVVLVNPLLFFLCTLPFALILYTFVERPGILLAKRVTAAMSQSKACEDVEACENVEAGPPPDRIAMQTGSSHQNHQQCTQTHRDTVFL